MSGRSGTNAPSADDAESAGGILLAIPVSWGALICAAARALFEKAGFQGGIGLVAQLEIFLGRLVAAMGVGMVLLDQQLVAGLEAARGDRRFHIENGERLLAR